MYKIAYSSRGYLLSQQRYISDLLTRVTPSDLEVSSLASVSTCMEHHLKLRYDDGNLLPSPTLYQELVGSLIYFTASRPDISYVAHVLSQFMHAPTSVHYAALLRVLHYPCNTISQSVFYSFDSLLSFQAYSDVGWIDDPDSRRSIIGYCIFLDSSLISWHDKGMEVVSCSSTKDEYRAMMDTTLD